MGADCLGSNHLHTEFFAKQPSFLVEVIHHLHVIGQESDRVNHDAVDPTLPQVFEMIEDIRLEPRIARPPAPALVDERPSFSADDRSPRRSIGTFR